MFSPQTPHHHTTARQLGELGVAAPQVVAHRMTRLWMAGPVPSDHDREEFTDMVLEKLHACTQSWVAMFAEALRTQQNMFHALFGSAPSLWSFNPLVLWLNLAAHHNESAQRVFNVGLAPVHSKAVANALRLSRAASNQQTY